MSSKRKNMIVNLTPHQIRVYSESQFTGLQQVNPTTWVADSVCGDPILVLPSKGVARIAVTTEEAGGLAGARLVRSVYGEPSGIPEGVEDDDILVTSLPFASMAKGKVSHRMVSPYRVVRSRENGSVVFGCMGFTQQ